MSEDYLGGRLISRARRREKPCHRVLPHRVSALAAGASHIGIGEFPGKGFVRPVLDSNDTRHMLTFAPSDEPMQRFAQEGMALPRDQQTTYCTPAAACSETTIPLAPFLGLLLGCAAAYPARSGWCRVTHVTPVPAHTAVTLSLRRRPHRPHRRPRPLPSRSLSAMDRLESLGNALSQITMYDIKSVYNQVCPHSRV